MKILIHYTRQFEWKWWYSEYEGAVLHLCPLWRLQNQNAVIDLETPCPYCELTCPDFIKLAANLNISAYSR